MCKGARAQQRRTDGLRERPGASRCPLPEAQVVYPRGETYPGAEGPTPHPQHANQRTWITSKPLKPNVGRGRDRPRRPTGHRGVGGRAPHKARSAPSESRVPGRGCGNNACFPSVSSATQGRAGEAGHRRPLVRPARRGQLVRRLLRGASTFLPKFMFSRKKYVSLYFQLETRLMDQNKRIGQ